MQRMTEDQRNLKSLAEELENLQVSGDEESINQHTSPIPANLTDNEETTSYIQLRSRKINQGTPSAVELSEYLNTFYEQAKKSKVVTEEHCKQLEKEVSKARKLRAEKINKFKLDTERFLKHLHDFRNTSVANINEIDDKKEILNSSAERLELSGSDFALAWLETSLSDSLSSDSISCNPHSSHIKSGMANYEKVAKLTSQMVPLFSGEPSTNLVSELHTFIGCCRQVQKCLSQEDLPAFFQIFLTRLRGNAYQLISTSNFSTFDEVEKLLNNAYLPRETYQEAINKLITSRQYPLETFSSFTSRVRQILEHCKEIVEAKYGETGLNAMKQQLEDFAIAAIKSGATNPHLTMYLLALSETSLDVVVQKALDMERLQLSAPYLQQSNVFPQVPNNISVQFPNHYTNKPQKNNLPEVTTYNTCPTTQQCTPFAQNQAPLGPTNPFSSIYANPVVPQPNVNNHNNTHNFFKKSNPTILAKITCSYCKIKGHTYDECLKRKNTPFCLQCKTYGHDVKFCKNGSFRKPLGNDGQIHSTNEARVYNIHRICEFCGRRGHEVSECRQKQKWENRESGNDHQSTGNPSARL